MKAEAIRELVRQRIEALGTPLAGLSRAVGKNHSYLYQYVTVGKPRTLPEPVRDLLAPLIGLTPSDLKADVEAPVTRLVLPESNARHAPEETIPASGSWPLTVPVLGTAEGGAGVGDFEMNGEVVDYVRRPPGVANLRDLFALYCVGTSMIPWRQPGEPVYCSNARRKPQIGDHVIVEMRPTEPGEPARVYLKRLVAFKGPSVILGQYNPPRDDLAIPTKAIRAITRVLEWAELTGI